MFSHTPRLVGGFQRLLLFGLLFLLIAPCAAGFPVGLAGAKNGAATAATRASSVTALLPGLGAGLAQGQLSVSSPPASSLSTTNANGAATTLEGRVLDADLLPVPGASVVTNQGGQANTDALGRFTLPIRYPATITHLRVTAVAVIGGTNAIGNKVQGDLVVGGVTQVGDLVLILGAPCEPDWIPTFGGLPGLGWGGAYCATVFDAGLGAGPELIVGGGFKVAGGIVVNRIVRWDGDHWWPLGDGMTGTVFALAVFDAGSGPRLIAGGSFLYAGTGPAFRVAQWDGHTWSPMGAGTNGTVYELLVEQDPAGGEPALFAGGAFTHTGLQPVSNIARWDGTAWSSLGTGMSGPSSRVTDLARFDRPDGSGHWLVAAGVFEMAGGFPANNIAAWDGSNWSPLGAGLGKFVSDLCVYSAVGSPSQVLVACGSFSLAGGLPASRIAQWDGDNWSPLGSGLSTFNGASAMGVHDHGAGGGPFLLVSGTFPTAGGIAANGFAQWNGASWSVPGTEGGVAQVQQFVYYQLPTAAAPELFAVGESQFAGGQPANSIARLEGSSWKPVKGGLHEEVNGLLSHDDGSGAGPALYVSGDFLASDNLPDRGLVRWGLNGWSPVGDGPLTSVGALESFDDGSGGPPQLIAAGGFSVSGGGVSNFIASWDGQQWKEMGGGMNGWVYALATFDDGSGAGPCLIAGGDFTVAGGLTANRVARWDGAAWTPMGNGMDQGVRALKVVEDGPWATPTLVAGGLFHYAMYSFTPLLGIARWNGADWEAIGSGVNGAVFALEVLEGGDEGGPALVAGGSFSSAGSVSAARVAKWNGTSWSAMGTGMGDTVMALARFRPPGESTARLFAGGQFTQSGSFFTPLPFLAYFKSGSWWQLDAGLSHPVSSLAVHDDGQGAGEALYIGGGFDTSPGGDSYLAKWGCPSPLQGYSLEASAAGLSGSTQLQVAPVWDGARVTPLLRLDPWQGPGIAHVLISESNPAWPPMGDLDWAAALAGDVFCLPITGPQGILLGSDSLRALRGREVQIRALVVSGSTGQTNLVAPLKLRFEQ
jgi:hypothetical protein